MPVVMKKIAQSKPNILNQTKLQINIITLTVRMRLNFLHKYFTINKELYTHETDDGTD